MSRVMRHLAVWLCIAASTLAAQGVAGPSLSEAKKALAVTEEKAIEMGVSLSCAVVDARGALIALTRMDGARYFTADVAVGKARASAAFGSPSGELGRLASMGLDEAIHGGPMLFVQGAVPIMESGESAGALGCSGASAQQDEDAARAAVSAIQ